ncbi:MAG: hypothetical protein ACUVQX_02615 [Candidatus Bathycorpusculaceae bacterium]
MQVDVENLTEIPCFKCLFWKPIKQSSVHCNPNECPKLTEWLLQKAEDPQQNEASFKVFSPPLVKVREKGN